MSKILSNIISDEDRKTIALIIGVFVPGAGHILMGRTRRGVIIVITAVLLGYISGPVSDAAFNVLRNSSLVYNPGPVSDAAFNVLRNISAVIGPLIIWLWQIK